MEQLFFCLDLVEMTATSLFLLKPEPLLIPDKLKVQYFSKGTVLQLVQWYSCNKVQCCNCRRTSAIRCSHKVEVYYL